MAASGCHVEFAADDGLDAGLSAGLLEPQHPKHIAVVRQGQGFHAQLLCPAHQIVDFCGGIQ